jgi:hypothetical protein
MIRKSGQYLTHIGKRYGKSTRWHSRVAGVVVCEAGKCTTSYSKLLRAGEKSTGVAKLGTDKAQSTAHKESAHEGDSGLSVVEFVNSIWDSPIPGYGKREKERF